MSCQTLVMMSIFTFILASKTHLNPAKDESNYVTALRDIVGSFSSLHWGIQISQKRAVILWTCWKQARNGWMGDGLWHISKMIWKRNQQYIVNAKCNKKRRLARFCDGDGVGGAVRRVFPCGTYATKSVSSRERYLLNYCTSYYLLTISDY